MTRVTRVKKNSGTPGKKGMEVENITAPNSLPVPSISLRDMEKFGVLFSRSRGVTKAKVAKKYHLSIPQVTHIEKNNKLSDFPISAFEVAQGMQRLNAGLICLQQECLEAMTPEKLAAANLAQLSITMGIAADKTKQYDAHLSGSMDHTPVLVAFKDREAILDRISQLQKKQGIRTIDAEVIESPDQTDEGGVGETGQLDLFPGESVEVTSSKKDTGLCETEVLQESPVGTLRRRTGVEPRRSDEGRHRKGKTGYSGVPGREDS